MRNVNRTEYAVTPTSSNMNAPCRKVTSLEYGENGGLRVVFRAAFAAMEKAPFLPAPMLSCIRASSMIQYCFHTTLVDRV